MNKKRNIWIGLLFMAAGTLSLLSASGVLQAGIFMYFISFCMLVLAIYWLFNRNFFGGMYALALMLKLYPGVLPKGLANIGYFKLFFIASLFAIGLSYLFKNSIFKTSSLHSKHEQLTGPHIACSSTFNNNSKYIYGNDLVSGDLSSTFGTLSVYFNDVNLQNDLNLNISVTFGSIELFFPRDWNVVENVSVAFGDVKSMVRFAETTHTVYISGSVSFGDLKISYF